MKNKTHYRDKGTGGIYYLYWLEGDSIEYCEENLFYWAKDINELEPYLKTLRRSKAKYCLIEAHLKHIWKHPLKHWVSFPHPRVFAIFTLPFQDIEIKEPYENNFSFDRYNRKTWPNVLKKDPKFKEFDKRNKDLTYHEL